MKTEFNEKRLKGVDFKLLNIEQSFYKDKKFLEMIDKKTKKNGKLYQLSLPLQDHKIFPNNGQRKKEEYVKLNIMKCTTRANLGGLDSLDCSEEFQEMSLKENMMIRSDFRNKIHSVQRKIEVCYNSLGESISCSLGDLGMVVHATVGISSPGCCN